MYSHRRDDHDGDHKSRPDGAEEAERDEETTDDLADRGRRGESGAGLKAELHEELACPTEAIASKPSQQLLRPVRGHDKADDDPQNQESEAHCRQICVSTHGAVPSINIGYC